MKRNLVPERTFLKDLALRQFNFYKNEKFLQENCNIQSIPPEENYAYGYEITSLDNNDTFRLRMYLNLGKTDHILPYQLKLDPPFIDTKLGDEIFVTYGTVELAYKLHKGYDFGWLEYDLNLLPIITTEKNNPLSLTSGGYLFLG